MREQVICQLGGLVGVWVVGSGFVEKQAGLASHCYKQQFASFVLTVVINLHLAILTTCRCSRVIGV